MASAVITLPPAVLQRQAHPARSERYVHIDTRSVIDAVQREGFTVASVQVTASRSGRDPLYARHLVDLRRDDLKAQHGTVPRFLFVNSHDGSCSAQIMLGAFRLVCSNGLVVGTTYARERVRHAGDANNAIIERARTLAQNTAPMFERIERWSALKLSATRARKFAELAGQLRWGDPHRFPAAALLAARRAEDARSNDLWTVFNRVQENAVRGGLAGRSKSGREATSRPLSDIVASNAFNAQLWLLADEFANL